MRTQTVALLLLLGSFALASTQACSKKSNAPPTPVPTPTHPGSVDLTFGSGGLAIVNVGAGSGQGALNALAIVPGGAIACAGAVTSGGSATLTVAALTSSGKIETQFGTGGVGTFQNGIATALIASNGALVGAATNPLGSEAFRFFDSGIIDGGFSGGRVLNQDTGHGAGIAAASGGGYYLGGDAVVVIGTAHLRSLALYRLDDNGAYVPGFGNSGKVTTTFPGNIYTTNAAGNAMAITGQGEIVLAGQLLVGNSNGAAIPVPLIARYSAAGVLDTSFGARGLVLDSSLASTAFTAIAVQPDNKLVVAGGGSAAGQATLARYLPSGARDTTFGTGGVFTNTTSASFTAVAVDGSGKILGLVGPSGLDFSVYRLTAAGAPDATFGTNGLAQFSFSQVNGVEAIEGPSALVLDPQGRILMGGSVSQQGGPGWAVVRLVN